MNNSCHTTACTNTVGYFDGQGMSFDWNTYFTFVNNCECICNLKLLFRSDCGGYFYLMRSESKQWFWLLFYS
jgi:hypothetical protein